LERSACSSSRSVATSAMPKSPILAWPSLPEQTNWTSRRSLACVTLHAALHDNRQSNTTPSHRKPLRPV
jgi:hypothetical protein